MKNVYFESGQQGRVELLGLLTTADNLEVRLERFFSRFGEIRKIAKFDHHGKGHFYSVDFTNGVSAVNAANATGCCKFGFNAVLVDPARLKSN